MISDPTVHAGIEHESAAFRWPSPARSPQRNRRFRRGPRDGPRPSSRFRSRTDFVDIVAFDALAKTVADHLVKGRKVAVTGRLRLEQWTNSDGQKRSKLGVVADGVIFLDRPKTADTHAGDAAEPAARDRDPYAPIAD